MITVNCDYLIIFTNIRKCKFSALM